MDNEKLKKSSTLTASFFFFGLSVSSNFSCTPKVRDSGIHNGVIDTVSVFPVKLCAMLLENGGQFSFKLQPANHNFLFQNKVGLAVKRTICNYLDKMKLF